MKFSNPLLAGGRHGSLSLSARADGACYRVNLGEVYLSAVIAGNEAAIRAALALREEGKPVVIGSRQLHVPA